MSSVAPSSRAILAFGQPRDAKNTIVARNRSRYGVLWPYTRFFNVFRSLAASTTGTARIRGIALPG